MRKKITLSIEDDYIDKFMALLNALPVGKIQQNYQYIDDLGDTIDVFAGEEQVVATKEDIKALQEARNSESYSLEDIKKERQENV